MKLMWIIVTVLFIVFCWLYADYVLGRRKHRHSVQHREYPVRSSHLELFVHGHDLFSSYFRELRNAKDHIHVLFYIVKNDSFSQEFLNLLMEKAREGVEVRLLADWVGSKSLSRKTVKKLKESGVAFSFCHKPAFPYLFYSFQIRNHRKITIIDGRTGYIGGYNIGKEYIDADPELTPWRDYHLKVTGEGVHDLQKEFLFDWKKCVGVDLFNAAYLFPELEQGNVRHQIIQTEGFELETIFSNIISMAEKSIMIGTPYFIPSPKLFNELLKAIERGVELTVIIPAKADHILVKEASYRYFRILIRKGANIFQYKKGFYHAKALIIDEKVCDIGTANFDKRSLYLNFEINCYTYDLVFINRARSIMLQDMQDSQRLTLEMLNTPNPVRTIKEMAARIISNFL